MATNRGLRRDLLKKLGVSQQRLSQRVAQVKRLYGPMTTEEGTYVLAHQQGLDLTKYLDTATVDRIRSMLSKDGQTGATPARTTKLRAAPTKPVRIAPRMEVVDAMLPASVAKDASRMADVYPKLYVLENSLRNVINRVLTAKHGRDWWSKRAPTDVQNRVKTRKEGDDKKPWHGKRGSHEIYYSDFGDLSKLITKNWNDFKGIFPTQQWITQKLEELEPPRNIVAHNNPLSAKEQTRIELYSDDWIALLNDRRDLVR
ncbi:MAG: Swt1 family HEPN domain-containing protein [Actinomycetota bacterium]